MKEESHEEIFARLDKARAIMTDFRDCIHGKQRKSDDAAFRTFMDNIQTPIK